MVVVPPVIERKDLETQYFKPLSDVCKYEAEKTKSAHSSATTATAVATCHGFKLSRDISFAKRRQPPSRRSRLHFSIQNSLYTNKTYRRLSARRRGIRVQSCPLVVPYQSFGCGLPLQVNQCPFVVLYQ